MSNFENLISKVYEYKPYNEQETKDKEQILSLLKNNDNILLRDNKQFHMTASAWVVNKSKDKVLMVYHNIYHSWSWLGGHADGDSDLLQVALKEVSEESGLKNLKVIDDKIYSLEILTVDGHVKRKEYVSSHLHLNVTFLIEADEEEMLTIKADENSGVKWFLLDDAILASTEEWFKINVYPKLNEKLKLYK